MKKSVIFVSIFLVLILLISQFTFAASTNQASAPVTTTKITTYFYAGTLVASKSSDNPTATQYYIQDHLGSNMKVLDNGVLEQTNKYYAFGETTSTPATSDNNYKYTGKELDSETGLYYYGARYYNPGIGRFMQADALQGSIEDPLSMNRYSYTRNNPLKFVDPSGSEEKTALILVSATGGKMTKEFQETHSNLVKSLTDQGYSVTTKKVENEGDIASAIKEVGSVDPINRLEIISHASPNSLLLQGEDEVTKGALQVSDVEKRGLLNDLSGYFAKGAEGRINGCNAAGKNDKGGNNILQATSNALGIPMTGTGEKFYGIDKKGNYLTGTQNPGAIVPLKIAGGTLNLQWSPDRAPPTIIDDYPQSMVDSMASNPSYLKQLADMRPPTNYFKKTFKQDNSQIKRVEPQK